MAFAFVEGGELLSPRAARAAGLRFRTLTEAQAATLAAFGDALAPGAAEAGIAHFIDHQISIPTEAALLTLRYLDVPPPYAPYYEGIAAAVEAASQATYGKPFAALSGADQEALIGAIATGTASGWFGVPSPLAYFIVRADAVDVVYGTVEGFEALGIPYMPHIVPPRQW